MRTIDADALLKTIEDHEPTVSCCPTDDWSIGKAQMKKQIIKDIRNAPTISDWNSVKGNPPELCEPVLVTGKNSFGNWFPAQIGYYNGEDWFIFGEPMSLKDFGAYITHWMPRPEPPKEVIKDEETAH